MSRPGHHIQPVAGGLGLAVGDVEVPDGRRVLRRVPVGGPVGRGEQAEDQRGQAPTSHGHGCHLEAPAGRSVAVSWPSVRIGRVRPGRGSSADAGVSIGDMGRRGVEVHDSGYRGTGAVTGYARRSETPKWLRDGWEASRSLATRLAEQAIRRSPVGANESTSAHSGAEGHEPTL